MRTQLCTPRTQMAMEGDWWPGSQAHVRPSSEESEPHRPGWRWPRVGYYVFGFAFRSFNLSLKICMMKSKCAERVNVRNLIWAVYAKDDISCMHFESWRNFTVFQGPTKHGLGLAFECLRATLQYSLHVKTALHTGRDTETVCRKVIERVPPRDLQSFRG